MTRGTDSCLFSTFSLEYKPQIKSLKISLFIINHPCFLTDLYPSLVKQGKNGVHFGHQTKYWHPKMKPYIHTNRGGLYIIDLEKTAEKLKQATDFISKTVGSGGKMLMVSTKQQAQPIIKAAAKEVNMPFVTDRWIGGTLTNFKNITKLVRRLKDLRAKKEKGELEKYTKLERLKFSEEIENLEKLVGGIESLEKLPQAMFVIDIKKEKTAVREARNQKIPIVAIVDTNVNPELVDYPIPANDDATKSIKFIVQAIKESVKNASQKKAEPPVKEKEKDNSSEK